MVLTLKGYVTLCMVPEAWLLPGKLRASCRGNVAAVVFVTAAWLVQGIMKATADGAVRDLCTFSRC